jgi:ferredoxin-thioredoxin reductase catalytic subunit
MPVTIKIQPREGDKINPNEQEFNRIFRMIAENNGHCITKIDKRFGHDICPCQNYLAGGKCFCKLYIKDE